MNAMQQQCMESWRNILPEYQIKEWNESNFDVNQTAYSASAYELGKYAFVADVCRLFALQKDGGIYMDLDMLVLKNFDPFLNHDFFLGYEAPNRYSAGIIGAKENNPVINKLISEYANLRFDPHVHVIIPDFFVQHILKEEVVAYPEDYFYPLPFEKKGEDYNPYLTKNTYAVHLWNHSWMGEKELLRKFKFFKASKVFLNNLLRYPKFRNLAYITGFRKSLVTAIKSYIFKVYTSFRSA